MEPISQHTDTDVRRYVIDELVAGMPISEAELMVLPSGRGWRFERVDGKLHIMSPSGFEHGESTLAVGSLLRTWARQSGGGKATGGEPGFRLPSGDVRCPDVAWVAPHRVGLYDRRSSSLFPGVPDLAVEIISPRDSYADVTDKVALWLDAGTREVWLIEPVERWIEIHTADTPRIRLTGTDQLRDRPLLPGFMCCVEELFPDIDEAG